MADCGKIYNQCHDQEAEKGNEAGVKEDDNNNTFGSNMYGDILKEIENNLFSDSSFPALPDIPVFSLSSSSTSALHWLNQIHKLNMHSNPAPMQLGSGSMVQEPGPFDDHLDPFLSANDFIENHKDLEIPQLDPPSKLVKAPPAPASNQSDPDIARFFLNWLKFNRDSISREDMKTIRLNKATVDHAAAMLGNNKEGKMKLVQLILTWVQEHRLHKNKPPLLNHLPPLPPPPPQTAEQYICLTPKEARKRRMEHLRRSSVFRHHKPNVIKPISEVGSSTSTSSCKYDSKMHNLRTEWQNKLQNDPSLNLVNTHPTISNVGRSITAFMERKKARIPMEPKLP